MKQYMFLYCLQDPLVSAKYGFLYGSYSRAHPYWGEGVGRGFRVRV